MTEEKLKKSIKLNNYIERLNDAIKEYERCGYSINLFAQFYDVVRNENFPKANQIEVIVLSNVKEILRKKKFEFETL